MVLTGAGCVAIGRLRKTDGVARRWKYAAQSTSRTRISPPPLFLAQPEKVWCKKYLTLCKKYITLCLSPFQVVDMTVILWSVLAFGVVFGAMYLRH